MTVRGRPRRLASIGAALAVLLGLLGVYAATGAPAHAATSQFRFRPRAYWDQASQSHGYQVAHAETHSGVWKSVCPPANCTHNAPAMLNPTRCRKWRSSRKVPSPSKNEWNSLVAL